MPYHLDIQMLQSLTESQLYQLYQTIKAEMAALPEGSENRCHAQASLDRIAAMIQSKKLRRQAPRFRPGL